MCGLSSLAFSHVDKDNSLKQTARHMRGTLGTFLSVANPSEGLNGVVSAKILALVRLSVNFFSYG